MRVRISSPVPILTLDHSQLDVYVFAFGLANIMSRLPLIQIHTTTDPDRIRLWCIAGLQNRIHFRDRGGLMEHWYRNPKHIESMAIAVSNMEVIGMAMIIDYYDEGLCGPTNVGVYVKWKYRQRGIGKALIQQIKRRTTLEVVAARHDKASTALYDSTRVRNGKNRYKNIAA